MPKRMHHDNQTPERLRQFYREYAGAAAAGESFRDIMGEFAANLAETEVLLASLDGSYITETVASIMPYPFVNFKPQED